MHTLRLHYFDFHGGRGEVARLVMALGEIPFEDHRIPLTEWPAARDSMPLRALPVLEVDGEAITQSNSINRFLGRLTKLYPVDPLEALRCDEVMDAVEDVITGLVATFGIEDQDELKAEREAFTAGPLTLYLTRLQEMLVDHGGEYFADGRMTIADLKVFIWVRSLRAGHLDYIPADLPDKLAPRLVEHMNRIASYPGIVAYYKAQDEGDRA